MEWGWRYDANIQANRDFRCIPESDNGNNKLGNDKQHIPVGYPGREGQGTELQYNQLHAEVSGKPELLYAFKFLNLGVAASDLFSRGFNGNNA